MCFQFYTQRILTGGFYIGVASVLQDTTVFAPLDSAFTGPVAEYLLLNTNQSNAYFHLRNECPASFLLADGLAVSSVIWSMYSSSMWLLVGTTTMPVAFLRCQTPSLPLTPPKILL